MDLEISGRLWDRASSLMPVREAEALKAAGHSWAGHCAGGTSPHSVSPMQEGISKLELECQGHWQDRIYWCYNAACDHSFSLVLRYQQQPIHRSTRMLPFGKPERMG